MGAGCSNAEELRLERVQKTKKEQAEKDQLYLKAYENFYGVEGVTMDHIKAAYKGTKLNRVEERKKPQPIA
jgi:hypothetical protein